MNDDPIDISDTNHGTMSILSMKYSVCASTKTKNDWSTHASSPMKMGQTLKGTEGIRKYIAHHVYIM